MAGNDAISAIRLALLIDGDNVSAAYMPIIMREAGKLGTVAIRRIYGQFKSGKMKSWMKQIEDFGITPVNVSPLVHGKNATDMKLVIEAMDMLHGRHLDGVCIASSDGDFTPLAARIRASALAAYGFGAKKAPAAYKEEFEKFFECDTLLAAEKKVSPQGIPAGAPPSQRRQAAAAIATPAPAPRPVPAPAARPERRPAASIPLELRDKIFDAIDRAMGPDGRANVRAVGNAIRRVVPDFQSKDYGFGTTGTLVRSLPGIEVTKKGSDTYVSWKRTQ
jgi:hypothetical protein